MPGYRAARMPLLVGVVACDRGVLVPREELEDPLRHVPLRLVFLLVPLEVELGVRDAFLGHRGQDA